MLIAGSDEDPAKGTSHEAPKREMMRHRRAGRLEETPGVRHHFWPDHGGVKTCFDYPVSAIS